MKVFISQPMRGRTDEEILSERDNIFNTYADEHPGAVLLDSFVNESAPDTAHPRVWYLSKTIGILSDADVVLMAKGWESYPGCRIEQKVATYYDIPVKYA
jgi:hypothetical protein